MWGWYLSVLVVVIFESYRFVVDDYLLRWGDVVDNYPLR